MSKLIALSEAIARFVPDGSSVALGLAPVGFSKVFLFPSLDHWKSSAAALCCACPNHCIEI